VNILALTLYYAVDAMFWNKIVKVASDTRHQRTLTPLLLRAGYREAANRRLFFYVSKISISASQGRQVAPIHVKSMCWIEKWLTTYRMVSTYCPQHAKFRWIQQRPQACRCENMAFVRTPRSGKLPVLFLLRLKISIYQRNADFRYLSKNNNGNLINRETARRSFTTIISVHPVRKTIRWIQKWLPPFRSVLNLSWFSS